MTYSFTDFLRDVNCELFALVGKSTVDFPDYEFESDFDSGFPVALSAQEAIIQHGSISEVELVDPNNICIFHSADSNRT